MPTIDQGLSRLHIHLFTQEVNIYGVPPLCEGTVLSPGSTAVKKRETACPCFYGACTLHDSLRNVPIVLLRESLAHSAALSSGSLEEMETLRSPTTLTESAVSVKVT